MSEIIHGKQCGDKHILLSAVTVGRCLENIAKVLKKQISEIITQWERLALQSLGSKYQCLWCGLTYGDC